MQPSFAGSSDVSVADLVSTSGADWANRNNDAPYRRPPAMNSFRNEADEEDMADSPSWSAFGSPTTPSSAASYQEKSQHEDPRYQDPAPDPSYQDPSYQDPSYQDLSYQDPSYPDASYREPEFGPAPPNGPGRTGFGVTAGPISGNRERYEPTSGARRPTGAPDR